MRILPAAIMIKDINFCSFTLAIILLLYPLGLSHIRELSTRYAQVTMGTMHYHDNCLDKNIFYGKKSLVRWQRLEKGS